MRSVRVVRAVRATRAGRLCGPHVVRTRRIVVSYAVVRTWWGKCRVQRGELAATSAKDVYERYGDILRAFAAENLSAYRLCKALREKRLRLTGMFLLTCAIDLRSGFVGRG